MASLHALPVADGTLGGLLAWYSLIHTHRPSCRPRPRSSAGPPPPDPLLTAFQAGTGQRVDRSRGHGHTVNFTNYRHDPQQVAEVLTRAGFDVLVRVHRAPEGQEQTAQHLITATRRR